MFSANQENNNDKFLDLNKFIKEYYENNAYSEKLLAREDNEGKLWYIIDGDKDALPILEQAKALGYFQKFPELINSRLTFSKSEYSYSYLLHIAVEKQSTAVIEFMLNIGADPDLFNSMYKRAIDIAIKRKSPTKAALLLIASLKKRFPSGAPFTSIHLAHELLDQSTSHRRGIKEKIIDEIFIPSFPYKFDFSRDTLMEVYEKELDAIQHDEINFSMSFRLGEGSYSCVYKGMIDSCPVAIKLCQYRSGFKEQKARYEASIHLYFEHPNLSKYICKIERYDYFGVVMEYCNDGNLKDYIEKNDNVTVRNSIPSFSLQMIRGLKYLHDLGFVHLDFKPANVLLHKNKNWIRLVICDFGSTAKVGETRSYEVTTYAFSPPERFEETNPYQFTNDIYSFGITLANMETKKKPWNGSSDRDYIYTNVVKSKLLFYRDWEMRKNIAERVRKYCDYDPEKRPSSKEIASYLEKSF